MYNYLWTLIKSSYPWANKSFLFCAPLISSDQKGPKRGFWKTLKPSPSLLLQGHFVNLSPCMDDRMALIDVQYCKINQDLSIIMLDEWALFYSLTSFHFFFFSFNIGQLLLHWQSHLKASLLPPAFLCLFSARMLLGWEHWHKSSST